MSSADGWSTAKPKRSRNKRSKDNTNLAEEESIKIPNPDLLDPIFTQKKEAVEEEEEVPEKQNGDESLDIQENEEDGFVTVTHKRKNKKGQPKPAVSAPPTSNQSTQTTQTKRKRKRKTKKKKSQRVLAEEDEEKDQLRARNDFLKGCPVEYYSSLADAWIKATCVSSYDDEVTIEYYSPTDPDMPKTGIFSRFGEEIRPIKEKETGFYYPLPEFEEDIVVKERREQPKKKSKKKKKNAVKKVSTKEEIYALIDVLLKNQGPVMGMTEIANSIKDNLNQGSWGKRYKSKFGSLKKFLSGLENFTVYEENGQILVRRLEPEPEPTPESAKEKVKKASTSSGGSFYLFIIVVIPILAAVFLFSDDTRRAQACTKLEELLGDELIQHLDAVCKK